jgi:hypothetical protein
MTAIRGVKQTLGGSKAHKPVSKLFHLLQITKKQNSFTEMQQLTEVVCFKLKMYHYPF